MTDQQRSTVEERLGTRLQELRKQYGMSQQQVADAMLSLGFSWRQTTVAKTEAAERPVPVGELVALSGLFSVSLDDLLASAKKTEAKGRADSAFRLAAHASQRLAAARERVELVRADLNRAEAIALDAAVVHDKLQRRYEHFLAKAHDQEGDADG